MIRLRPPGFGLRRPTCLRRSEAASASRRQEVGFGRLKVGGRARLLCALAPIALLLLVLPGCAGTGDLAPRTPKETLAALEISFEEAVTDLTWHRRMDRIGDTAWTAVKKTVVEVDAALDRAHEMIDDEPALAAQLAIVRDGVRALQLRAMEADRAAGRSGPARRSLGEGGRTEP